VLVNNAGVYPEETDAKVVDTPTSIWRETFETNLFGAVRTCREVVSLMRKLRYGRIVNISSGLGQLHQMGEGSPAYRVSKAALNALNKYLAGGSRRHRDSRELDESRMGEDRHGRREAPRTVEEGADTATARAPALERTDGRILQGP
jgi:hypothetical protein